MGWSSPHETSASGADEFDTSFDFEFAQKTMERAVLRVPCLADARIESKWSRAGLYEMTPDHHAIIGQAPGVKGFFLANGFSGHGVMHSPATGRLVAELILYGEARLMDITSLRLERFAEGARLYEPLTL